MCLPDRKFDRSSPIEPPGRDRAEGKEMNHQDDIATLLRALDEATAALALYIDPGSSQNASKAINQLLGALDNQKLFAARERLSNGG